ncbi:hypothetical protein ACOMHN_021405 [Nucella lapillus]
MSSKSKRRVTVDPGNTVSEDAEKRKPSVFERLGPGAGHQRKYSEIREAPLRDYDSERERQKKCRPFLLNGECPYGATCKYKHVQLSRKSRSREDDASPENLRLKLKGGPSERGGDKRRDSDSESRDPPARCSGHVRRDKGSEGGDRPLSASAAISSRRDKETKIRSQVVVKKSENQDSDDSGDDSDTNWFSTLDYKKELELEQKRQQLQRELSQLAEEEVENITIQKKVPVSPSDSDSSPERGRSNKRAPSPHNKRVAASPHDKRSTSPGGRSKKEKKKHRTKSPPDLTPPLRDKKVASPPGLDKPREHKRKHEAEEESHKKHKKKKERKRSISPLPPPPSPGGRRRTNGTNENRPLPGQGQGQEEEEPGGGKRESDSDESHGAKSKKWLSPLKKTLKLKKVKAGSVAAVETKLDEGRLKQRSASPKAGGRGGGARGGERRDPGEDPVLPSRSAQDSRREADLARSRGRSTEKRGEKKLKGRQSQSPAHPRDRSSSSTKRGEAGRDPSFGRKARQSESPPLSAGDRSGRRGGGRAGVTRPSTAASQGGGKGEERGKRPPSPPPPPPPSSRQTEMYSPSQLDRDSSPVRESSQRQPPSAPRGRQGDRDPPPRGDEERRGAEREGRRGEKFESSRGSSTSQDRSGQERFGRRSGGGGGDGGDSFDQFGSQDRGQFDPDRNRWDYRDNRGQEGDRDQRGRRGDHFERGMPPSRDPARGEGRDLPFDRADSLRGSGGRDGRDVARDNEGRGDRGRDAARDRGDNRGRDRDGRGALAEGVESLRAGRSRRKATEVCVGGAGGKYGPGTFPPDGQRRSGQWEAGARGVEWGGDPSRDPSRDLPGGRLDERGRMYRDDGREGGDRRGREVIPEGRPSLDGGRMERPDSRADRGDGRLDRGDNRLDRGDNRLDRGDGRLDRNDGRLDRGDNRLDRGDNRLDRGDSRLDRADSRGEGRLDRGSGDGRLDRGDNRGLARGEGRLDRGDNLMEHHRGEPPAPAGDQRGFRQGRGMGSGPDGRGGSVRGGMAGTRASPGETRGFDFDRRGDGVGGREGRLDREVVGGGLVQLPPPPRDRFLPGPDFRRDEPPGFRGNLPEGGVPLRDRRGDDRFIGPEGIEIPPPRAERRFEDGREDRMRGPPGEDRLGRDRMLPHRGGGGHFDFGRGPGGGLEGGPPQPPPPPDLLPNQRRGPLLPTPVEEPPKGGGGRGEVYDRDPPRVGRDRARRDTRDADFGPEMGRGGREGAREGMRDPGAWERDKDRRLAGNRDGGPREPPGRRGGAGGGGGGFGEDVSKRRGGGERDRGSPRRDGDRTKDNPSNPEADRRADKKDGGESKEGGVTRGEKGGDASDARSTRSADDVRELAGSRGKEAGGGGVKGGRERDSRSDGKRSPDQSQGKGASSLPFSGRRQQPVRARSLSPKQRPKASGDSATQSPGRRRSPGRHGPSPRPSQGGRSRTPVGTKRKLDEDLRSPRGGKDDTKSPLAKRPREDSKSPARKGSRHPSPAGSHHSRGSHSSERRRRMGGLTQREPESRFFGAAHDRDSPARRERERESPAWRDGEKGSPARRERDKENKGEKTSESSKGDSDKTEGSRKRARSPPRSHNRGSDSGDRGRKRWRGEKVHPAVEAAWQAGFEPQDIENKLVRLSDPVRQRHLGSGVRNQCVVKVVLDKRYDRERLISESEDLVLLYDCRRQGLVDWFLRQDRRAKVTHFEDDAQNCLKVWSPVTDPRFKSSLLLMSSLTRLVAAAVRRFLGPLPHSLLLLLLSLAFDLWLLLSLAFDLWLLLSLAFDLWLLLSLAFDLWLLLSLAFDLWL